MLVIILLSIFFAFYFNVSNELKINKKTNNLDTNYRVKNNEIELKKYINDAINADEDNSIKSIKIEKNNNEKYNIMIYEQPDDLYLCVDNTEYYTKKIKETSNKYNNMILSVTGVCYKENYEISNFVLIDDFASITEENIFSHVKILSSKKETLNVTIDDLRREHINNFKNSCVIYDYKTIFRYSDEYKGKNAKFTGKVIQIMDNSIGNTKIFNYRVNVTLDKYGIYDDTIYVTYVELDDNKTPRILEDDIITIYGILDGLQTYNTIFGSSVTIPSIIAKYIDIN